MAAPDAQEPLLSSGDEEPLVLAEEQASKKTPGATPSRPTEEAWLAPNPSRTALATGTGTSANVYVEVASAGLLPRRRGLNGRHFQQLEPYAIGPEGTSTLPLPPGPAGNHVEPPSITEPLGSARSGGPWAILTNEVDVLDAGEWGCALEGSGRGGTGVAPRPSWLPNLSLSPWARELLSSCCYLPDIITSVCWCCCRSPWWQEPPRALAVASHGDPTHHLNAQWDAWLEAGRHRGPHCMASHFRPGQGPLGVPCLGPQ